MVDGQHRLAVPSNPEYSVPQLRMMLREVEQITGRQISSGDWEKLRRGVIVVRPLVVCGTGGARRSAVVAIIF